MKRLLIIDDEPPVREALARFLSGDGHAVRSADSLESALQLLRREPVDAVICDVDEGIESVASIVDALRAAAALPHLACVLLTTSAPADATLLLGVTIVAKPIRLPDLRARLHETFQRGVA